MKKRRIFFLALLATILVCALVFNTTQKEDNISILQEKHSSYLSNSPYKDTKNKSRKQRKSQGLPPNAYYEQQWELTMNPNLGRPTPENLEVLQYELQNTQNRAPGDAFDNLWEERGPNNIGGRTKAILFDPNDINNANPADDYTRVFAGSVSGGLWVNNDITDANSSWNLVTGLPDNISVTVIAVDPNDSNTFYLGSGESYTSGYTVGSGVYKSTDGGGTWQQLFGGNSGTSSSNPATYFIDGFFYVNDLVVRNNNGTTEVYAAIASAVYRDAGSPFNVHGYNQRGLYKSVDGGANWSRFPIQYPSGLHQNPNDIEIDINNNIWLATTGDFFNNPGGYIYSSSDGITFNLEHIIPNAKRTEIEPSSLVSNTFWIVAEVNGFADVLFTDDGFATVTPFVEPNDADNGISATDFARNQAFYDLVIEADENDNLYIGGIDLFKYNSTGAVWDQISKWKNTDGLETITASLVHADQHAIVFRPNNNNHAIIGNDGGIYFSDNITTAVNDATAFEVRNKDYNVTQFYFGAIADSDILDGDDIIGGTQDNGTLSAIDTSVGINGFSTVLGGDGAYVAIDEADGYAIVSFPFMNHAYLPYPSLNILSGYFVISETNPNSFREGEFINDAELDKTLNTLYTNASTSTGTNRIGKHVNVNGGNGNVVTTFLTNALLNASPTAFKISANGQTLYAGLRNGRLLKIDNIHTATPTWNDISDTNFVGSISDIEFGMSENQLLVTFHNYGVINIWSSPDQGMNWDEKDGNLPDFPVKTILMNPLVAGGIEVIVGTELGIWRTQDFNLVAPTWQRSDNGMRAVPVLDLDMRLSDHTVLATTHGRGMFTGQFLSGTLSNAEIKEESGFLVFPTVSTGIVQVQSESNGKAMIEVFSMQGKQVFKEETRLIANEANPITLQQLASGMYIMKITQNSRVKVLKIQIEQS